MKSMVNVVSSNEFGAIVRKTAFQTLITVAIILLADFMLIYSYLQMPDKTIDSLFDLVYIGTIASINLLILMAVHKMVNGKVDL